jgi:predicted DNA binding protein
MRRLLLELPIRQFGVEDLNRGLDRIKSYTVLQRLKQDRNGYTAIARIELKNPARNLAHLIGRTGLVKVQSIYREGNRVHVALVTFKATGWMVEAFRFPDLYPMGPLEIRDDKVKIGFVGNSSQISKFLEKMERARVKYKVLALSDAKFSADSPLSKLTDKQKTILLSAYNLGYYDIPRRFDSEQLAKKLNLGRSTVAEHLRKAENRLITDAISQQDRT